MIQKLLKFMVMEFDSEHYIRYLAAILDETLNFKEHVKRKCRTAMIT